VRANEYFDIVLRRNWSAQTMLVAITIKPYINLIKKRSAFGVEKKSSKKGFLG